MTPVQVSKVTRLGGKGGNQGVVWAGGAIKNELFWTLLVCPVIFGSNIANFSALFRVYHFCWLAGGNKSEVAYFVCLFPTRGGSGGAEPPLKWSKPTNYRKNEHQAVYDWYFG